jgi:GntR family transcriptional repressor for pyruvate dehydrogenase complex
MTLREAIATLRRRGLVETKRGRNGGTFVQRRSEPPEEPDRARLAATTVGQLRDLGDEQSAISGATGELAASRATPHDLRRLAVLAEQLVTASSRGARIRADSRFHTEIAVATRSERLLRREVLLRAESSGMLWLPHITPEDHHEMCAEHDAIVAAIAAEDGEAARTAAARHIRADLSRLRAGHRVAVAAHDVTDGNADG